MQKNIILCGFMGSGKSTVGRILAKRLKCRYIDMDRYIEETAQMKIPDIFAEYGEDGFRELEHKAAYSLGSLSGAVIATGGGALTFERNIAPLRKNSCIVYLNVSFDTCYGRIKSSDRPLVRSKTKDELNELFKKRDTAYRRAASFIAEAEFSEEMADVIIKHMKNI